MTEEEKQEAVETAMSLHSSMCKTEQDRNVKRACSRMILELTCTAADEPERLVAMVHACATALQAFRAMHGMTRPYRAALAPMN